MENGSNSDRKINVGALFPNEPQNHVKEQP